MHAEFVYWVQVQTSSCSRDSSLLCEGNGLPFGYQLKAYGKKDYTGVC